jgi:hypothetical protein
MILAEVSSCRPIVFPWPDPSAQPVSLVSGTLLMVRAGQVRRKGGCPARASFAGGSQRSIARNPTGL